MAKTFGFAGTMVLDWRDGEHEDMDRVELGDPMTLNSIQRCGLLNFYRTSKIQSQVRILEMLVQLWDLEQGMFELQGETLELSVEEIYFVIGLSHKGA